MCLIDPSYRLCKIFLRWRITYSPPIMWQVGFNFDGTLALTGSYDGTVRIWDVRLFLKYIPVWPMTNLTFTSLAEPSLVCRNVTEKLLLKCWSLSTYFQICSVSYCVLVGKYGGAEAYPRGPGGRGIRGVALQRVSGSRVRTAVCCLSSCHVCCYLVQLMFRLRLRGCVWCSVVKKAKQRLSVE